jgi:ribosomal protein S18 acetylase RimI-like enzyme
MTNDLPRLRSVLGASTALWAREPRIEAAGWLALSGARGVDYNVALCHGATEGELIRRSIEEINAARAPGLIMVAGDALGEVQHLIDASWVCVGSVPFMSIDLAGFEAEADPGARRLERGEMDEARALVADVFGIGPELADVAIPDAALETPGQAVWGLRAGDDLVACTGAVAVDEAVVIWSMATASAHRRRGHGARLLTAVLVDAAQAGLERSLLHASPDGEPFYGALGYSLLERWQIWSRPRWVLGHA